MTATSIRLCSSMNSQARARVDPRMHHPYRRYHRKPRNCFNRPLLTLFLHRNVVLTLQSSCPEEEEAVTRQISTPTRLQKSLKMPTAQNIFN